MRNRALSLSLASLLVACLDYSDDCRNTLTCRPPHPVVPYCDGRWYFTEADGDICKDPSDCSDDGVCCTEDGVCPYCPQRGEDGVWRYPEDSSMEPWDATGVELKTHRDIECGDPTGAGGSGSGGEAGSQGVTGLAGHNGESGSAPNLSGAGGAAAGGDGNEVSGAAGGANAGAAGWSGSAGTEGGSGSGGESGAGNAPEGGAAGDDGEADPCAAGNAGTSSPDVDACAVEDSIGVFVASDGADDAPGTEAQPVATLGVALSRAAERGLRAIYVCAERNEVALEYTEAASITGANGLKVYGGFDCTDAVWTYDTTRKARFSLGVGASFRVDATAGLELADIAITAAPATEPGENSVALWVTNSTDVSLTRLAIRAGEGAPGATADLVDFQYEYEAIDALDGHGAASEPLDAGAAKICRCANGTDSMGGSGGAAVSPNGAKGGDGSPDLLDSGLGVGSPAGTCTGGLLASQQGALGSDSSAGPGASESGAIDADGTWHAQAGEGGDDGGTGQGGGGGGSTSASNAGGGGGCGGCGGAGAPGGAGGGASIALLVVESTVTIAESTLDSSDGGAGGNGVQGQVGQESTDEPGLGGFGGAGIGNACDGGHGGRGGHGGASGGGAGGLSVGILWLGEDQPRFDGSVTIDLGEPGRGGSSAPDAENAGIDGHAEMVLDAGPLSTD